MMPAVGNLAFRIGVARCWVGLRTCQLVAASFQGLEPGPGFAFAAVLEIARDRQLVRLDAGRRDSARFIEAKLAGVDDEKALGLREGGRAIGRSQSPTALERRWNGRSQRRRRCSRGPGFVLGGGAVRG